MTEDHATAAFRPDEIARFHYVGADFDADMRVLTCRYALDDLPFAEVITFDAPRGEVDREAVERAARLVFLLAGVSYYKAAAPPEIVVSGGLTASERSLLESHYLHGLGEYAFENDLDLAGISIVADDRPPSTGASPSSGLQPLIPFGGGLDSVVTVEMVRALGAEPALFIASTSGARYESIERAAAVTGLPIVRAERRLDPKILRSAALGYRNGHVPVTGILSAIAVVAALLDGRDAVIMSNECSSSDGNFEHRGRTVNHQWSKGMQFEDLFRAALADALRSSIDYFSELRPFSELWVASQLADLPQYHLAFQSCNRAHHIDKNRRLDRWCGVCDKCCFIDLILAPYLPRTQLEAIFGGTEPLADPALEAQFLTLLDLSDEPKPFECVGDVHECRAAASMAAKRDDRSDTKLVQALAAQVNVSEDEVARLLGPIGPHRIPERYAPPHLLG